MRNGAHATFRKNTTPGSPPPLYSHWLSRDKVGIRCWNLLDQKVSHRLEVSRLTLSMRASSTAPSIECGAELLVCKYVTSNFPLVRSERRGAWARTVHKIWIHQILTFSHKHSLPRLQPSPQPSSKNIPNHLCHRGRSINKKTRTNYRIWLKTTSSSSSVSSSPSSSHTGPHFYYLG